MDMYMLANACPLDSLASVSHARSSRDRMACATFSISGSCRPGRLGGRTKWLNTDSIEAMICTTSDLRGQDNSRRIRRMRESEDNDREISVGMASRTSRCDKDVTDLSRSGE